MRLWQILVPTITNEGKPVKTRHHRVWDKKVRELAGGLTVMPKNVAGYWLDENSSIVYNERMIPCLIACEESIIEKIADWTAKHYKQLAIMYYLISDNVKIVEYHQDTFKRKKKV